MIFGEKYDIENADIEEPIINHEQKEIILNPENPKHRKKIVKQLKNI